MLRKWVNLKHFFTAALSHISSSLCYCKQAHSQINTHTVTHIYTHSESPYQGYQPALAERQGMLFLSPPPPPPPPPPPACPVDQWGSSWASTINQSLSAICLQNQPITGLRQLGHEKCGPGGWRGGWMGEGEGERREVKEHSIWSESGHGSTTALYALTVDS